MKNVSVKSQSCVSQGQTISHANDSMEGSLWEEIEIHTLDHVLYSVPMPGLYVVLHSNTRTHEGRYRNPQYPLRQSSRTLCDCLLVQLYPQWSSRKLSRAVPHQHTLPRRLFPA